MRGFKLALLGLGAIVMASGTVLYQRYQSDLRSAKDHFIAQNHEEAKRHAAAANASLTAIYQNLRLIASLPSIRAVDRHGENLTPEARTTLQQVYNNLADNVSVSEVYIVPIDFAPDKLDAKTGKTEDPIAAFDQLIVHAGNGMSRVIRQSHPESAISAATGGPPEIEEFEYRQLADQARWLREKFPSNNKFDGLTVPFITSPEVITCDNTYFINSGFDGDRSGLILSVPFYDGSGQIKGLVSSIILSNAIKGMLTSPNMALVNSANRFAIMGPTAAQMSRSEGFIRSAMPDETLAFSEVSALPIADSRSVWQIWIGESNEAFEASVGVVNAKNTLRNSLLALGLLSIAALACILLAQRNLRTARESAEQLQRLNADISTLNTELAQKLRLLSEAQDAIIKSGRMAQLGQLVATVAHEIRNPLGSVRTTSFALKRKLDAHNIDVSSQIQRIEGGITRCVNIINQLLDFSRTQDPLREPVDLCQWVQTVIEEELSHWPEAVKLQLEFPENGVRAHIDTERMRRCLINMISNASEALVAKNAQVAQPLIIIHVSRVARGFEITFQDNGPGISEAILKKIGEPLFTTKNFGTGLGIAATRKVAEVHGGGLEISSKPGKGARFTIWFPDVVPEAKAA